MNIAQPPNSEQNALWNGAGGRAWVESQTTLDQMLQPFDDLLLDAGELETSRRVLDVGCGTGSTSIALARRLHGRGHCTGIDISEPMLAKARARAAFEQSAPSFVLGDAQTYGFEPSSFDAFVSRFGVMFFDDPLRAFANLRSAGVGGARFRFVAWRGAEENAFMTTAERVARPLLPNLPARRANEPGQFAFADAERLRRILAESGWSSIDIEPRDVTCSLPEPELMHYVTRLGPVGRILQEAEPRVRAEFAQNVRAALAPFVHGASVVFTSASWLVSARA